MRSQRDRLLAAIAQECYELFDSREGLFLAAYDAILAQFLERVTTAYGQTELDWPERVQAAVAALLSFLASEPAFARMWIVEVLAAGERALERYDGAVAVLAGLLDEGRALTPDPDELSASTTGDVIEGGAFVIREQILAGRTRQLQQLAARHPLRGARPLPGSTGGATPGPPDPAS